MYKYWVSAKVHAEFVTGQSIVIPHQLLHSPNKCTCMWISLSSALFVCTAEQDDILIIIAYVHPVSWPKWVNHSWPKRVNHRKQTLLLKHLGKSSQNILITSFSGDFMTAYKLSRFLSIYTRRYIEVYYVLFLEIVNIRLVIVLLQLIMISFR